MIRYPSSILFIYIILRAVYTGLWTDHPIITWVFLEVILISVIPFIGARAAVRYFIIQALRSLIFFVGVIVADQEVFYWLGMATKLGLAPMHWWVPVIYQERSWSVIFMLRVVTKIVPFSILDIGTRPGNFVYLLISFRLLVGAVGGLRQSRFKPLLAYSSIGHIGWITSTLLLRSSLWIPYLFFYTLTIMVLLLWTPTTLRAIVILLSLGGLPPLIGFFPKLLVIGEIWKMSLIISRVLVGTTSLSLVYYTSSLTAYIVIQPRSQSMWPVGWFLGIPLTVLPILSGWGQFGVIAIYLS